jgi:ubiquinone/menaquinone biosynthesis C-methylase UbiE
VFSERERIFDSQEDPAPPLAQSLADAAACLEGMRRTGFSSLGAVAKSEENTEAVESVTGDHYGSLFQGFSPESYWEETVRLLSLRLERNGISLESVRGKSVLDAGCGGGRYTGAWRILGAKPATGLDISPANITDARGRAAAAGLRGVEFREGNVLSLDVPDNSFDIVFSNGVLHHTRDWEAGIAELLRALKPGGLGWLYLIENPGGLFWDSIEILRVVMRNESRGGARAALRLLEIPGNRIFYMLDHVMVPINVRLTTDEIEEWLAACGAVGIRRLERGVDFDRVERIHQGEPYAREKFGIGEHRYVFTKA